MKPSFKFLPGYYGNRMTVLKESYMQNFARLGRAWRYTNPPGLTPKDIHKALSLLLVSTCR